MSCSGLVPTGGKFQIPRTDACDMKWGVVVHGGAGSPRNLSGGPASAATAAMNILRSGGRAVDASAEATKVMEDDDRFNAGTGSVLRFDGNAYMDAAVMDSEENCGVVAYLTRTKNPVLVARKVMESPHVFLAADGAVDFARKNGFNDYDSRTPRTINRLEKGMDDFRKGIRPEWPRNWKNYKVDTVGAVAMDGMGRFAAAGSTGGTFPALKGRVGDIAMIGCGIFAGPEGAVAATGIGEEIIRKVLSKTVYDYMCNGLSAQEAVDKGVSLYDRSVSIGIISINSEGFGIASTTDMASHHLTE